MEEAQYQYFNTLMRTSTSNTFFMLIITYIEFNPFVTFFIESPLLIRHYIKDTDLHINNNKIINVLRDISLYHQFTRIRYKDTSHYPLYIIILFIFFLLLYIAFIVSLLKLKSKSNSNFHNKTVTIYTYCESIISKFFDHLLFRSLSLFYFEILINYIVKSSSYGIQIMFCIILLFSAIIYCKYLSTNRLIIKYNKEHKYKYDNYYMLYSDYINLILKIVLCLNGNFVNKKSILFYINIIALCILICINILFCKLTIINNVSYVRSFFYIVFLSLSIIGIIFEQSISSNAYFIMYILSVVFSSVVFVILFRMYIIYFYILPSLTNTNKDNCIYKFELFCEYYDTPCFEYFFNKLCFANKVINYDKSNKNALKSRYIKTLTKLLKKNSENYDNTKYTFYYIISKIYKKLMTDNRNTFKLLFKTWEIIRKLKNRNFVYYINLRFFYQKLCDINSTRNNGNYMLFYHSYFEIYDNTLKVIDALTNFISKKEYDIPQSYIEIADKIKIYQNVIDSKYKIIANNTYKDEYQKILLRIIIEGILNKPIYKTLSSMLILEEIGSYEEIIDKHFHSNHQLLIKLNLQNASSQIIKIGKTFNKYINKKIESIFPIHFQHLGLNMLYKSIRTLKEIKQYHYTESFHFMIYDGHNNLKAFNYIYKIYPDISLGLAYIDGVYQLEKEDLIITEVKEDKDYLLLTSEHLESYFFINQSFLNLLCKYELSFCLNELTEDSIDFSFGINALYLYLEKLRNILLKLCTKEDIDALNIIFNRMLTLYNAKKQNANILLRLVYKDSILDKERNKEYKSYSLSVEINNHLHRATQSTFTVRTKNEVQRQQNNNSTEKVLPSYINDNNSVSSNISVHSSKGFSNSFTLRKKKENKKYKKNNYIIIVCNILIIILSVVCLTYENGLNTKLKETLTLFKTTFLLNRFILKSLINFFSMFCGIEEDSDKCINRYNKYLNENEFEELYQFEVYELELRLEIFPQSYSSLKQLIEQSDDTELQEFLQKEIEVPHIVYVNGYFNESYYSIESFDFAMLKYINSLIMIANDNLFQSSPIYPIILDENFKPVRVNSQYVISSFNTVQLKITEILSSYLTYSDCLSELKALLDTKTTNQHKTNKLHLTFFILGLMMGNIIVAIVIFVFFGNFSLIIQRHFSSFENSLENAVNVDNLNIKFKILSDMTRLFYKSPIKQIYKLSKYNKTKRSSLTHNTLIKEKIDEFKDNKGNNNKTSMLSHKKYNVGFLIHKYIFILICFLLLYLSYCIIFYLIYSFSFDELNKIIKVLQTSSYTEEETYLVIGIIQIMEYVSFPVSAISKVLPFNSSNKSVDNNYFETMLNDIEDYYIAETIAKDAVKSIPTHNELIDFNCDTMYTKMKDSRFEQIIQAYPQMNYEQLLISYCKSIPSIQFGNQSDKYLMDEILYKSTKLLLNGDNFNAEKETEYNQDELYDAITELLYILRPLRKFYYDYYYNVELSNKMDTHYVILIVFLMGNIIIQIIYFVIIKGYILDRIESIISNLEGLNKIINN